MTNYRFRKHPTMRARRYYEVVVDGSARGFVCPATSDPTLWEAWVYGDNRNLKVERSARTRDAAGFALTLAVTR